LAASGVGMVVLCRNEFDQNSLTVVLFLGKEDANPS